MISSDALRPILVTLEKAAESLPSVKVEERYLTRVSNGEAALTMPDLPYASAAELLVTVLRVHGPKTLAQGQALQVVTAYWQEQAVNGFWETCGINAENANVYLHLACQAALAHMAQAITKAAPVAQWVGARCPVCGDGASFACLEKDSGKRTLVCGGCFTHWSYKRIGCCFCHEDRPDHMKRLTTDDFPGWLVSVCNTCRGYLKTADLRVLAAEPEWREIVLAILPLDYAVQKWLAADNCVSS